MLARRRAGRCLARGLQGHRQAVRRALQAAAVRPRRLRVGRAAHRRADRAAVASWARRRSTRWSATSRRWPGCSACRTSRSRRSSRCSARSGWCRCPRSGCSSSASRSGPTSYDAGAADDPMLVFNVTDQVRETIQSDAVLAADAAAVRVPLRTAGRSGWSGSAARRRGLPRRARRRAPPTASLTSLTTSSTTALTSSRSGLSLSSFLPPPPLAPTFRLMPDVGSGPVAGRRCRRRDPGVGGTDPAVDRRVARVGVVAVALLVPGPPSGLDRPRGRDAGRLRSRRAGRRRAPRPPAAMSGGGISVMPWPGAVRAGLRGLGVDGEQHVGGVEQGVLGAGGDRRLERRRASSMLSAVKSRSWLTEASLPVCVVRQQQVGRLGGLVGERVQGALDVRGAALALAGQRGGPRRDGRWRWPGSWRPWRRR